MALVRLMRVQPIFYETKRNLALAFDCTEFLHL